MTAAVTAAWQAALGTEHQAVHGYALLGPMLGPADRPQALAAAAEHATARDTAERDLLALGVAPDPTAVDYPALYPVPDATAARRLAVRLEQDCAAAWRYLYDRAAASPSSGSVRAPAQAGLTASAVRAARWRRLLDPARATTPFPGI